MTLLKFSCTSLLIVLLCSLCFSQYLNNGDSLYQAAQRSPIKKRTELLLLAAEAFRHTDTKRAIKTAEEALGMSTHPEERAKCELTLGRCTYVAGEHDLALNWYLKSLSSYEKLNDKSGQSSVLNEIGTLVKKQGNVEKSTSYFREGLVLAQEAGDSIQLANSMNNLGIALEQLGKQEEAMTLYRQSADIKRKLNDIYGLSYNLDNMGMLLTTMKKYLEAEQSFEEAAAIRLQLGDRTGYGIILNNIGEMWQARNNSAKALDYFMRALSIAEETNYTDFKNHLYSVLSGLYEQQKEYEKAIFYLRKHQQTKDSLFNEQKSAQLLEMEAKYETEKKELMIEEQRLKLERNQAITIGLIALLILIVLVIILWRKQLSLREQRNLEQQQRENQERLTKTVITLQEKERSRFAQDLHDGFGQLITALKMQFEKTGQRSDTISELIQHMHDEIRNVSFALSPQVLVRDGLIMAMKELAFRINRSKAIVVNVQSTFTDRLPGDYEITLYRVCQEWINNVLKYSGSTKIDIQLIDHSDEILLMIEDNGKGFSPLILENATGNGWKNIQSRIQILEGRVEIDSHPERHGTTFTASIPKQYVLA